MYLNAGHRPASGVINSRRFQPTVLYAATITTRVDHRVTSIEFQHRHRRLKPTAIYNPHFIRVGIPSDKPAKLFSTFKTQFSKLANCLPGPSTRFSSSANCFLRLKLNFLCR